MKRVQVYKTENKEKDKSPKSPSNKTRNRTSNDPLTREECNLLFRSIDDLGDYTLILTGLYTGMRISEISQIGEILISPEESKIRVWDEKKDLYRDVFVNQDVISALKRFISIRAEKDPRIFPWSVKTIERKIQHWTGKTLSKTKSWHAVRHTYISLSREMGIPMEIVIANTGDSAATILKYYSKPSAAYIRRVLNENRLYD